MERLLGSAWDRRVTLVVAGAGYGKTTALRHLAGTENSRWLGLRAADREVERLAGGVAEALGVGSPGGGATGMAAIGASDRRSLAEGRAAVICESLDARQDALLLVLDDVDQLEDNGLGSHFLSTLCLQAPARLHIVLSGRRLPPLGLGSLRGRGELLELNAPDLAFTVDETRSVLQQRLGPDATALVDACWRLTGGWAAALQLVVDRLERLDAARWEPEIARLSRHHGSPWREFAADLVRSESPTAQRILTVAGIVSAVDAELLRGLELPSPEAELDSLQSRGLLVVEPGVHAELTLSPVLSEVVGERLPADDAGTLRLETAEWLEQADRLEEALECAIGGPPAQARALLGRCGERLVARGYALRVVEVIRDLGTEIDPQLETILAQALVAVGDWDGAMELFETIRRRRAGQPLPAAIAWRFGALLYMRSDTEAAQKVLTSVYREDQSASSDAAQIAAWLSSTLWMRGDVEGAEKMAGVALDRAQASGDPSARGAAHVALAMAAAARGERDQNERHYRLALRAATQAGDSVQLARIHANLSARAAEEGDYQGSIREADLAISAAAGHSLFSAVAMSNKAEVLMHLGELEEARALLAQAISTFSSLGSLMICTPYTQLAELEAQRGELARARRSLERAARLAEEGDDAHAWVIAMADLAGTLADEDAETARRYASEATARATSLERAYALCSWSWVELTSGHRQEATRLAARAEAEARRTDDIPSRARACELLAVAAQPTDQAQLEEAARLWHELGAPIASRRAELMLAACRGETDRARALREELSSFGVQPEYGVAALLVSREQRAEVEVTTLGRFTVTRAGQAIPLAEWQSRKARDLLKLLAARRGRPLTREAATEALWPAEAPGPLANRLSVALSTLRKVLDPERTHSPDQFVVADNQSLALRIDHVSVDVVGFLRVASAGIELASEGDWAAAGEKLRRAESVYTGDFLEEDLYEDWAVDCREEARAAAQEVSRLLARAAVQSNDDEGATRHLRRLLERDPYDGDAWIALLGGLLRLRRYGEARRQHTVYTRRMGELGIAAAPLARTAQARP